MKNIGVIGYGNIGKHLVKLLQLNKVDNFLTISDKNNMTDNIQLSDVLFLTVNSNEIEDVCKEINIQTQNGVKSSKIIISTVEEVSVDKIKEWTNNSHIVSRCMPNILISILKGNMVWLHDPRCDFKDIKLLHDITKGPSSLIVDSDKLIDSSRVLSHSHELKFISNIYEEYIKSGCNIGFKREDSKILIRQAMEETLIKLKHKDINSVLDYLETKQ